MQLLVFEDAGYRRLLPLVYSRATFNLRCGFDNLLAKIERATKHTTESLFVRPALAAVMAERQPRRVNQPATADDQLWVNGRLLLRDYFELPLNSAAWRGETLIAARLNRASACKLSHLEVLLDPQKLKETLAGTTPATIPDEAATLIEYPWQLVKHNAAEIVRQAAHQEMTIAGDVANGVSRCGSHGVHVGAGTRIKPGVVLDADEGPIYIGDKVTVHANAVIMGPAYIGEGCTIQPGAIVRPGCSIGMVCKIGGEIEGTIFHGYSNKQHDGFIGHSYIGEWVNLGADTVGSDLKNTYGHVRVPICGEEIDSGEMFVGAFIGDHTKTAIRTTLPTGSVIGYACNIVSSGFAPKFVPSFSWVSDDGIAANDAQKALAVARTVVGRRNRKYSAAEEALFLGIREEAGRCERAARG